MSDSDSSVFGEEDNLPLPHNSGLASLIQSQAQGESDKPNQEEPDADESMLLYRNERDNFKSVQINYESRVTKLLGPNGDPKILITEAGKSNEGMANLLKKYVVYTIKLVNGTDPKEEIQTRRRYSDFESLRDVLSRIFPMIIIPPIPPKNYFSFNVLNGLVSSNIPSNGSHHQNNAHAATPSSSTTEQPNLPITYSYINSRHLNKQRLIEHRKRLLSNFLNNCIKIPQIRNLDFFAKFLDPSANWSDEIALITSHLPKSVYQLNPENGLKTEEIYSHLPLPFSEHLINFSFLNKKYLAEKTTKLLNAAGGESQQPDSAHSSPPNEANGDDKTKPENVKISSLDEINKKIMDNFIGLSNDYVELGIVFNAFALTLADSLEVNSSKSADGSDIKLDTIIDKIGVAFDRSYITINALVSELETKFSEPLGEAVQYSMILLSMKKYQSRKIKQKGLVDQEIRDKKKEITHLSRAEEHSSLDQQQAPSEGSRMKFPSISSLKKITKYVSNIMDQNPEETRRLRITQLQKKTTILEQCQTIMLQDIAYIGTEMEKNLKSFHGEELKTILKILLNYNSILMSWAKKTIDIWEEIKEEVKNF